jgi:hypothetical protein
MVKQATSQSFGTTYPNLARWVTKFGWIAIGVDGFSFSLVRVLDEGGMIWESKEDKATVDEALQAADTAIATWFEENGFGQ